MFPDSPVIEKSFNYDLFKKIEWNRSVDKTNFTKLVVENRRDFQLHRFPILVTSDYKIVDGQHRFEVAKELGSPIYFIRDRGVSESFSSVHSVNKAGKKHTIKDKLEMLYKAGDDGAIMVYKVYTLYSGLFELGTIAGVLSAGTNGGSVKNKVDVDGKLELSNYGDGIEVLDALLHSAIPFKGTTRMVYALAALSKKNGVHPKAIIKRTQANLSKWIDPKSKQEAERSFATCYNYKLEIKNRIKTSFEK